MSTSSDSEIYRELQAAASYWGVRLASEAVCDGHAAPIEFLRQQAIDRPPLSLWCGPRGGGKSFVSGLGAWFDSLQYDRHGTRILGGSLAQSEQIYEALRAFASVRPGKSPARINKRSAEFDTGSTVKILAASRTSVRGPHVATLRLDEVDEIDEEIRESSLGMCMSLHGVPASVVMTSTWHRVGGPMGRLMEAGLAGAFPVRSFCIFEVLERCPDERSGPRLEKCPECPLVTWCHADDGRPPKAKRSNGHYAIDALIQKTRAVSLRVFKSDYLCLGPRSDGVWFTAFDERNVAESAEYDPALPVHVAIDSGVSTAAVLFQVRDLVDGPAVNVFADYFAEGLSAEENALRVLKLADERSGPSIRRVSTDSSGGARNPVGPTVFAEYERAGLRGARGLESWPKYPGCVEDGLALIEALVRSADGSIGLTIHPRCKHLINALRSYRRAKRSGVFQDYPEDPQHPAEDLVDALRGGLKTVLPDSRKPPHRGPSMAPGRVI